MIGTGIRTEWEGGYVRLDDYASDDFTGRAGTMQGLGDWMSDLKSAVVGWIGAKQLYRLTSAVFKLNDQLRGLVESRNAIYDGYVVAKKLYGEAVLRAGGSAVVWIASTPVPHPYVLPSMQSLAAAKQGAEGFARQISTILQLSKVFNAISKVLTAEGKPEDANSIDQVTGQINRFVYDTDNKFAAIPEYGAAKAKIMSAALHEWGVWGVSSDAMSDPRWFLAFAKAAQMSIPMEGDVWPPPELSGDDGLSGLGEPLTLLAAIIWVVGIIAGALVVMFTISKLIDAFNSKAVSTEKLVLQRDKEKEALRQQMIKAGKTQAEIDAAMKTFDAETKNQAKDIPESGLTGSITTIAIAALAALVGLKVAKVI